MWYNLFMSTLKNFRFTPRDVDLLEKAKAKSESKTYTRALRIALEQFVGETFVLPAELKEQAPMS